MEKRKGFNVSINTKEGINVKRIIAKAIKHWYWFLLFGVIGGLAGIVYGKFSQVKYEVSSTILVKSESRNNSLNSIFQEFKMNGRNISQASQIGIIQSYDLNLSTLKSLQWDISWFKKDFFKTVDLYQNEPFKVIEPEGAYQTVGLQMHIKVISDELYEVTTDGDVTVGGVRRRANINERVVFGESFSNDYFDFTLEKIKNRQPIEGDEYILVFNDLNHMAQSYRERLLVSLTEEESDLIRLVLSGQNPSREVDYLNAIAKAYIQFGLDEKNQIADNTLEFINDQIAGITDSLRVASKDFTNFRSRNKIVNLGQEATSVVEKLEQVEKEESMARMRLEYYNNLNQYLNDAVQVRELVAPSVVGITDASLNSLVIKLSDLYSQREVLSYSVNENNPNLKALDNEIVYTKRIIKENISNLLSNTKIELNNVYKQKQKINDLLTKLPKKEQDLVNIKRSFDLNNDLYTFLLKKRAETGISKAANYPDAQVLDKARLESVVRIGGKKFRNVILALLFSMAIPLAFFVVLDYFDDKINSEKELEQVLPLSIVGRLLQNTTKSELPVLHYPNSALTESFRGLRTNISHLLNHNNQKTIAVHSTVTGEGKSFVSSNLAVSMALNGKQVLLVEGDIRKPSLHQALNNKNEKGLTSYLLGKVGFDEILLATQCKGLSLVSSGPIHLHSSELLSNSLFEKFIDTAKQRFDYIIFNNAPLSIINDGVIVSRHMDINLFLIRMDYSKNKHLDSLQRLVNEGVVKNLAVAINGIQGPRDSKAHGYYNDDHARPVKKNRVKKQN